MTTQTSERRLWGVRERALASTGSLAVPQSPLSLRYRATTPVRPRHERARHRARRVVNVLAACIGIASTAPLMLIIAVLVKLTSPGPIIFRQQRVGIDRRLNPEEGIPNRRRSYDIGGRIFTMYKFRTMRVDGGASREVWASRSDPRVTPVGHFLRATRLDELPQFFNVLKGDMNIVGPRPEQPAIFQELRHEVGRYRRRQRVLPGITGLAQVTVGYDTDLESVKKKVDLDLEYIRKSSAGEDLRIMARTLPVIVFRKVWM